ncbi:molybdenum cofactor guanylyltransferase [Rubrobacter taiwanensis]|jgi:molybdopterin-guanine dinucleotide biosynthesis protein A|uniref:Molybdenum cofactor guanylyltransferase n=2 Tax=Rubrobacter taiwanensis TaxID=185139 RepID=A0A4R1BHT8_9ACTN|nr:molybdenum cofactor guanylyltransferase [Rubrobacter taiwanensis]
MGRDKLRLEVGGEPLLLRACRAAGAVCGELIVAGRAAEVPGARAVGDLRPGREGPLAGVESGLAAARHPRVLVVAGDMPFLSPELLRYLLERPAAAAVPLPGGRLQPLCAAYDRGLLPLVREALDRGERSMRRFLESVEDVEYVEEEVLRGFGDPGVLLMNVNTPADLETARRLAG